MIKLIKSSVVTVAALLFLSGCQSLPQTDALRANPPTQIVPTANLQSLPFYPQQQYFCGPTTLSEVFSYYGKDVSPESLAPQLFIPQREGSLQIEMVAATRQNGFLAYAGRGELSQILQLIDEGYPVIVLQNLSLPWFPMWHYAVVKGYDLPEQELILHTGVTPNHRMSYKLFERTWQRSDYWMLVPIPTDRASEHLQPFVYVKAAHDFLATGHPVQAIESLKTATQQWPEHPLAYFLLGNFYLASDIQLALNWFGKGLEAGSADPAYLNNYAYTLAKAGCTEQASATIEKAIDIAPSDENIRDTQRQIKTGALAPVLSNHICPN